MRYLNFTEASKIHLSQSSLIYKIANTLYQSNARIPELNHLIESDTTNIDDSTLVPQSCCSIQIYSDTCSIGEQNYKLHVTSNNNNCYHITNDSNSFLITKTHINSINSNIDIHLLFGPVLILNLALNNTFCFHASAFILNNKVFILMADSGTGKSTIARYIDKYTKGKRIADDIVPMEMRNNRITVLPDFPQLKLTPEQQDQGKFIQKQVVLLFAKKGLNKTTTEAVRPFEALKKLIQHSVATKLFAPKELQNHLDYCYQISQNAQAYHVEYVHSEKSLQDLLREINAIT